jgi:hypothetical protein
VRVLGGLFLAVLFSAVVPSAALADPGPHLPCQAGTVIPLFAPSGPLPAYRIWYGDDFPGGWTPPACTPWEKKPFAILVATAGRFHEPGGIEAVAARFARISSLSSVRYWSVTRQRWRGLIEDAHALSGPDPAGLRGDFTAAELRPSATLFFRQQENTPAGDVIYRLTVHERNADRLVVTTENALPVRFLLLPLFGPGDYQTLFVIEREDEGHWRYYSLLRVAGSFETMLRDHAASYINRAVAIFRHIAGLPTDAEPPAARQEKND